MQEKGTEKREVLHTRPGEEVEEVQEVKEVVVVEASHRHFQISSTNCPSGLQSGFGRSRE